MSADGKDPVKREFEDTSETQDNQKIKVLENSDNKMQSTKIGQEKQLDTHAQVLPNQR